MTQNQAILEYLKQGYSLTGLGALQLFGTLKLASRVSELRKEGHDIKDCYIHDPSNHKKYKRYWIEQPTTKLEGQQFVMA